MSKIKLLTILAFALVAINILVLSFAFTGPKHHKHQIPHHLRPKMEVIKILELNDNQVIAYEKLIDQHIEAIMARQEEIALKKNELYSLLLAPNTERQSKLIDELSEIQAAIETIHFNHFQDIKSLCNAEQKVKFERLSKELSKIFGRKIRKH